MTKPPVLSVVCCVLLKNYHLFASRRSLSMKLPGFWELPGGKIEKGETIFEAIRREMQEEMKISVTPLKFLTPATTKESERTIELIPVLCRYSGLPDLQEHSHFGWISIDQLEMFRFAPADLPILDEIKKNYKEFIELYRR